MNMLNDFCTNMIPSMWSFKFETDSTGFMVTFFLPNLRAPN